MTPKPERLTAPVQPHRRHRGVFPPGHVPSFRDYDIPFPTQIPWIIHARAWSAYAAAGHGSQSAERLAERGGFGVLELVACLTPEIGYRAEHMHRLTEADVARVRDECEGITALRAELAAATERAADWEKIGNDRSVFWQQERARADAAEAQVAALREAADPFSMPEMLVQGMERANGVTVFGSGHGVDYVVNAAQWRALRTVLADTAQAAADHDARVRGEALTSGIVAIERKLRRWGQPGGYIGKPTERKNDQDVLRTAIHQLYALIPRERHEATWQAVERALAADPPEGA